MSSWWECVHCGRLCDPTILTCPCRAPEPARCRAGFTAAQIAHDPICAELSAQATDAEVLPPLPSEVGG